MERLKREECGLQIRYALRHQRNVWSWREESNLQPAVYKTAALPIELRQPVTECTCLR